MIKHRRTLLISLGALVAGCASSANAASFPCEKAATAVEKTLCSTPETSALDEYLGRYYAAARSSLRHAEGCLLGDQRNWLRTVRDKCKDTACLKRVYLDRLAVLDALQPGATSLRNIELPKQPALVWIVPPASDQVAAPRSPAAPALVASGRLVNEVSTGDGYVLQTDSGTKYLIVPLMLLEAPTNDMLAVLAGVPDARYEVRGHAERGGGPPSFAAGQCSFIYRTTP